MRRLQPGRVVRQSDGSLLAPDFGDTYASRAGALAQSKAVFLAGCDLPRRLTGRLHTVLETGFGTGLNALALAQAAHESQVESAGRLVGAGAPAMAGRAGASDERLSACHVHYVGIEAHPLSRDDLAAALAPQDELAPWRAALLAGWPPPMEGTYRWSLGPRLTLTLVLGEVLPALRELEARVDSVFLDGFAPDRNPAMWTPEVLAEVVAHCRQNARLASWCVAGEVRRALAAAGCVVERKPGFGAKRERLEAVVQARALSPRHAQVLARGNDGLIVEPAGAIEQSRGWAPADSAPAEQEPGRAGRVHGADAVPERALVIGAGIAGASAAAALAARGLAVTVLEADRPAGGASGNPLGVVRPEPSGLDHPISQLTAMATLWLRGCLEVRGQAPGLGVRDDKHAPPIFAERCGALRLPRDDKHARRLQEHAAASPAEWMRWVAADEAVALTGQRVAEAGVWIAEAWNLQPPDLVAALLAASGATVRQARIAALAMAESAAGPGAQPVWRLTLDDGTAAEWPLVVVANAFGVSGHLSLPLRQVRGQLSWAAAREDHTLKAVVCREGYVTPSVEGRHIVGATFQRDEADLAPRDADDAANQWRLGRLLPGWGEQALRAARVSVRAATPDRLPLVGLLAPGLYASLGHGSRGLTCAPLCGELLASMVCGEPLPLPRALVRRLDPCRFGAVQGLVDPSP